jgi:hypothetical protein
LADTEASWGEADGAPARNLTGHGAQRSDEEGGDAPGERVALVRSQQSSWASSLRESFRTLTCSFSNLICTWYPTLFLALE